MDGWDTYENDEKIARLHVIADVANRIANHPNVNLVDMRAVEEADALLSHILDVVDSESAWQRRREIRVGLGVAS